MAAVRSMHQQHPILHKLYELVNNKDPREEYRLVSVLGHGTYGEVYKAIRLEDGMEAAIKVMKIDPRREETKGLIREIQTLQDCRHINIVQYYGSYIRSNKLWLCMEYCGGLSIQDIYSNTRIPLDENCIAFVCRETLRGLAYLHRRKQVHRDIKGGNILLTDHGDVKLADFGVAAEMSHTLQKCNTSIGTPYWMAPEVCAIHNKHGTYDEKCDIWSVGITAIECAEMQPPFFDMEPMK